MFNQTLNFENPKKYPISVSLLKGLDAVSIERPLNNAKSGLLIMYDRDSKLMINYKRLRKQSYIYKKSGVYFVYYRNKIIYIGQTVNFHRRLWALKRRFMKKNWQMFDSFKFIPCPPHYLRTLEKFYIEFYKPRYNLAHNSNNKKMKRLTNKGKQNKIKELAKKKGLFQIYISEAVGVSRTNISHWMNNITQPKKRYVPKLCEILGVTEDRLFY